MSGHSYPDQFSFSERFLPSKQSVQERRVLALIRPVSGMLRFLSSCFTGNYVGAEMSNYFPQMGGVAFDDMLHSTDLGGWACPGLCLLEEEGTVIRGVFCRCTESHVEGRFRQESSHE